MDKNVDLTISSWQISGGVRCAQEDIRCPGKYYFSGGCRYLFYKEGSGAVSVRVEIRQGSVTVKKSGDIKTEMVFDTGKDHRFAYLLPFGECVFDMHTKSLRIDEDDDTLSISIDYSLSSLGSPVSENHIGIIAGSAPMIYGK